MLPRTAPTLRLAVVAPLAALLLVAGCFKEEWEGFVYPDRQNLRKHQAIGVFPSLEACRAAAVSTLRRVSSLQDGDYECGLNCEASSTLPGIKVCEKTAR